MIVTLMCNLIVKKSKKKYIKVRKLIYSDTRCVLSFTILHLKVKPIWLAAWPSYIPHFFAFYIHFQTKKIVNAKKLLNIICQKIWCNFCTGQKKRLKLVCPKEITIEIKLKKIYKKKIFHY